jgi:hypothetical protein
VHPATVNRHPAGRVGALVEFLADLDALPLLDALACPTTVEFLLVRPCWPCAPATASPSTGPGEKIAPLRRAGIDPPGHAQRPRWVAWHSHGGGVVHGGMPTMNDSSGVLALLAAAVPDGPRERDLMSLHNLARCIAVGFDMPHAVAGKTVIRALLGEEQWKGKPPASLKVYVRRAAGPCELCDLRSVLDGRSIPSDRWTALDHLLSSMIFGGCTINEVPEGLTHYGAHAGRFLDVVEADAWQAFGLNQSASTYPAEQPPATVPAAVQSEPTPAPEQPAEPVWKDGDHWTPAAVAEMVRLHEQEGRSLSDIGRVMGDRVGGPAISRQRVREKIPDSVRGGKGKCKGARD